MIMFDDALGVVERLLEGKFQASKQKPQATIVRDIQGAITVVLPDDSMNAEEWQSLASDLHVALENYSSGKNQVLLKQSDLIDPEDVIGSPDRVSIWHGAGYLVDRLITNQDWLREPLSLRPTIPTAVAFSIKGGVGRSTAFSMLAWYLARQGKRVLVIDLDLEAPGIGSILTSTLPDFGLIDWLIEDLNGGADGGLLSRCVADCEIGNDSAGEIKVIPAYGALTGNYVSKLGRVYMPSTSGSEVVGLAERLQKLLQFCENIDNYEVDVILLDARAGLHDIGSAAVTRLAAEAFFFGRNDDQNWWAFGQLFDHLRAARSVQHGMGSDDDLRWRLKMVAAQTEPREDVRKNWVSSSYEAWNSFYDDETAATSSGFEPQVFDRFSVEAPHYPFFINFDLGVRGLSLTSPGARPDWSFIQGIFGEFFDGVYHRLWPQEKPEMEVGK
ncbi:KGGVGR-motif variant AAA ATPase [Bordetella genomosp. 13]|uniref:KGGVGR-motif variant AAA ATPase n=1 Tax=Bordetella genomosp. 13 TaxID=463040 RepID=UPI00119D0778|nr:P-loop NTPase [Bordetella genomosp. 13]